MQLCTSTNFALDGRFVSYDSQWTAKNPVTNDSIF